VSLTPVANGKNLQSPNFLLILLDTFLWVIELAYRYIFFFKFILSCLQFDNCFHCLPPVSFTPMTNFPPVATTLVKVMENLPPVSLILVENLPSVLLLPLVHLDLRISPKIFEKIQNGLNGILWG
jgi:hypothetical protein